VNKRPLGYDHAFVDGRTVIPIRYSKLYHGTDYHTPKEVLANAGLPPKGNDLELLHHAEPTTGSNSNSAFRGTTLTPLSQLRDAGAALWGKWVYEIANFPGYDIASSFAGSVHTVGGYRGAHMTSEGEIAVPAEIDITYIELCGEVIDGERGPRPRWNYLWKST
jgi:hypothetical protein